MDGIASKTLDLSDLKEARRVMALFQKACSDLARAKQANAGLETCAYLESLVARGYAEVHSQRTNVSRFRPFHWLTRVFPRTFRKHYRAFLLASILTLIGMLVGGILLVVDPHGRQVALAPFSHVASQTPSQRVEQEEKAQNRALDELEHRKKTFSAQLMTNNIRVSFNAMALGLSWGVGTALLLFYNGVILGAVCLDYLLDDQGVFLLGWLLPHGSFEIPAILIAGQAGFVLAHAMIGWGTRDGLRKRLRAVAPAVATLVGGAAVLLLWAGFIEAFFSQYHAPILPYWLKITFGSLELVLLFAFLTLAGRAANQEEDSR